METRRPGGSRAGQGEGAGPTFFDQKPRTNN
jgi:hypothetical protein